MMAQISPPKEKKVSAPRRRFPAGERRAQMLQQAAEHFADHGFESPTREIAAALGVTQALIYKHFDSKEAFIEQALEAALGDVVGRQLLFDPDIELGKGLFEFYSPFVARSTRKRMRLFMRAGLDGRTWPSRRGNTLTQGLFIPVISALRQTASLPALDRSPPLRGERELVMMLHASMVFLGIRRHIYGMQMPENLDDVVRLYVDTFVNGAVTAIRELHQKGEDSLKIRLLAKSLDPAEDQSIFAGRKQTSSR